MRFKILISILILVILLVPYPNARADPLPVPQYNGSPYSSEAPNDIVFKSEKVVYTIDTTDVSSVSASYVFQNSANSPVSLDVYLPFDTPIPGDLKLSANGQSVAFNRLAYGSVPNSDYACALFRLDFAACGTLDLEARYSIQNAVYTDWSSMHPFEFGKVYKEHFWCHYIAETGSNWNDRLDVAEFQFRIKKDLYGSGLDGFNVTEEGGYIVATQTYYNWLPDRNIDAEWQRTDAGGTLWANSPFIIAITILIVCPIAVLVMRRRRKRRMSMQPRPPPKGPL